MSTSWCGWRNRIEAKQTYARFVLISIENLKITGIQRSPSHLNIRDKTAHRKLSGYLNKCLKKHNGRDEHKTYPGGHQ